MTKAEMIKGLYSGFCATENSLDTAFIKLHQTLMHLQYNEGTLSSDDRGAIQVAIQVVLNTISREIKSLND